VEDGIDPSILILPQVQVPAPLVLVNSVLDCGTEIGKINCSGLIVNLDLGFCVTVRSPCLSVVLVLEFSDGGISQIGSRPDVSIRKSS